MTHKKEIDLFEYRFNISTLPFTLSRRKAVYLLGVSKSTLDSMIRNGTIDTAKIMFGDLFTTEILVNDNFKEAIKARKRRDQKEIREKERIITILEDRARLVDNYFICGDTDCFIEYGELLKLIGRKINPSNQTWLKLVLEEISTETFNTKGFVLSILVQEKNSKLPSRNFWNFVMFGINAFQGKNETMHEFRYRQLKEIADYYNDESL